MVKNLEIPGKQSHIFTLWHNIPTSYILFQRYAVKHKMTKFIPCALFWTVKNRYSLKLQINCCKS